MKKWRAYLPGGHTFEFESNSPREAMIQRGYTAFALEEIVKEEN